MSDIGNCFKICWKSIRENKELIISFLIAMEAQGANTLADTYLMSWLESFIDKKNGPLFSKDEAVYLYQYQGVSGAIASFVLLYFFGKITDKL